MVALEVVREFVARDGLELVHGGIARAWQERERIPVTHVFRPNGADEVMGRGWTVNAWVV